jgi:hypothetical protein
MVNDKMSKPIVDIEKKILKYKNIEYEIVGSDTKNYCLVGENTEINQYIIYWSNRVGKRSKQTDDSRIEGLARDDCLVLNHIAHTLLSKAIVEYEEYCTQK